MFSIYLKCREYTYCMYKSCFLCKYCILKLYFPGFDGTVPDKWNSELKKLCNFFFGLVAKESELQLATTCIALLFCFCGSIRKVFSHTITVHKKIYYYMLLSQNIKVKYIGVTSFLITIIAKENLEQKCVILLKIYCTIITSIIIINKVI